MSTLGDMGSNRSPGMDVGIAAAVVVVVLLVLVGGRALTTRAAAMAETEGVAVPGELSQRSTLPPLVRAGLYERMRRHGEVMARLQRSATLLQYDAVADAAHAIQDEPRIARPNGAAPDDLNTALPPAFFDLQDALYAQARALAQAARERDDHRMARAYGRLAETCISCHALYLTPPPPGSGR